MDASREGSRSAIDPASLILLLEIEALEKVAEKGRLSVVVGEAGLAGRVVKLV